MGETTDEIEAYIETQRAGLGSNLHELEEKIRAATDWRRFYREHVMPLLGAAFGSGLLLGAVSRPSNHRRRGR